MNGELLELFWRGMALHLWQTTFVLIGLVLLGFALRRAPARLVHLLWWIALVKLLVPLRALEPLATACGRWISSIWKVPVEAGPVRIVEYVRVLLAPDGLTARASSGGSDVYTWLTLAWFAGMVLVLGNWLRGRGNRRDGYPRTIAASSDPVRDKLTRAIEGSTIPGDRIRIGAVSEVPAAAGLRRTRILVSTRVVEALETQELRAILLHEEAHRRRRDPLLSLFRRAALSPFFFYPPAWWIVRRLRESSEFACDESVLASGIAPATYARALARTLGLGLLPTRLSAAASLGLRGGLCGRLDRIENSWRYRTMHRHRGLLVVAVLLALGPLLPGILSARSEPPAGEAQVVEPWHGIESRFAALDRLDDRDLVLRLNFRETALEKVFESIERTSGLRIRVDGDLPVCDEIDLGPVTLGELLVHLAMKHDLLYDVEDGRTLHVRLPLLAGQAGVSSPRLSHRVEPIYPADEQHDGVEGKVILQAVILRDGSVSAIRPLREEPDHPAFTESAIEAVSEWRYEPATLNDVPVEVFFTIFVNFSLE